MDTPETWIIQLSGHKNLHGLISYKKKTSMEQQKDMSHSLSSHSLPVQKSRSTKDNSTPPLHTYLASAQLTGGTITISSRILL